jgi:hypothetical protein
MSASKGILLEYTLSLPPSVLVFEINPQTLTRSRSISITLGSTPATRGGYDFTTPMETPRVAQSVSVQPESFSIEILLDATDRFSDPITQTLGIEPELDTLRSMVEPKTQGPLGFQMLASLGMGGSRAFQKHETASVILFIWGTHFLPIFLKGIEVKETAHLPNLAPYRATVTLTMQVIEGNNPFFKVEKVRQLLGAAINTGRTAVSVISGIF